MVVGQAVRALASVTLAELSLEEVLERAAQVAKDAVAGADEVSVTVENGRPVTVAYTGRLALDVDESQYTAGYGPCLDAIRLNQTVIVKDQPTDPRWPQYRPRAVEAGIGSSMSVPLVVGDRPIGAFNIYATRSQAFADEAVSLAEELAGYAAVMLSNAGLYFAASAQAGQMREAMQSRAVIEQAKGILMGGRRCDSDEAFAILVRLSQQSGRKLHVVAQTLVDQAATSGP